MAVLSRLGLVQLDDTADTGLKGAQSQEVTPPINEPRKYSEDEVKREIFAGSDFAAVIEETQRKLARILSPDDLMRLFGIYDSLRLPPEVILQLITHCVNESRYTGDGRPPTMRYIEKAAYTWEREGIFTLEKAEEYLKALNAKKSARGEIKKVLQIIDREFSATEKRYVEGWIALGLETEAVEIAYDRTVLKTGKLSWAYMDSILKNWHGKGIHTAQQVLEKDSKPGKNTGSKSAKPGEQKYGEPNRDDLERMQRLLDKIKEE
jgi:DnaD/phage-associated family protein